MEETRKLLAAQMARERAELKEFLANTEARGIQFGSREEAVAALRRRQLADKVASRRARLEENERIDAILDGATEGPRKMHLVSAADAAANQTWARFTRAFREAKKERGQKLRQATTRHYGTSYETMRLHLLHDLRLDWRGAVRKAEAELP